MSLFDLFFGSRTQRELPKGVAPQGAPRAPDPVEMKTLSAEEIYQRSRHEAAMAVVARSMDRRLHGGVENRGQTDSDYSIHHWGEDGYRIHDW